jgi:long-chain acyl-CoA synthetase
MRYSKRRDQGVSRSARPDLGVCRNREENEREDTLAKTSKKIQPPRGKTKARGTETPSRASEATAKAPAKTAATAKSPNTAPAARPTAASPSAKAKAPAKTAATAQPKAPAKAAAAAKPKPPAKPVEKTTDQKTKPRAGGGTATTGAPQTASKPAATAKQRSTAKPKQTAARPDKTKEAAAKSAAEPKADARRTTAAKAARSGAKAPAQAPSRSWLASYPEVVAHEIPPLAYNSIGDLLVDSCRKYAARPAFTCMDKTLTYAELESMSKDLAAYLQSKGHAKGARIALMMPNVPQYPVAIMAVLRAGYTVVNVNPLYTSRELEHQLKDSGAEAIIILENFATTLQAVVEKTPVKHVIVASMGDLMGLKGLIVNFVVRRVKKMVPDWSLPGHVKFNEALKAGKSKSFRPAEVTADDIAFLQYTGGTTGVSKGAILLHRNVLANVSQNDLWVQSAYVKKPKPDRQIYVCALPLYHIYALTVNALMGVQQGAQNILIPNPRDIPAFVKELKKYPINVFPGLNTLFNALLNNDEFRQLDFSPLRLTFGGGMAVQRTVAQRWKDVTGIIISEGYGLSETAPVATANRFDAEEFTGTIGLPMPSTEISIRDDNGKDLPLGQVGEICIRGPQVMAGYWNRPDETAKVMARDGFFKSGDIGFMDEKGYVKIVDRKKDMILVSGFNVYPNEIEDVVAQHPEVLEVAAIGVPDDKSGEVPKLFVVKRDQALTAADLVKHCKENLAAYKCPKHVEFRSELPKTNVGKILRRELRG